MKGFVRNLGPGRVECVLQGTASDVRAMQRWLRNGPRTAVVTDISVDSIAVDPAMPPFHVRF